MNPQQTHHFVKRYFEAMESTFIHTDKTSFTVSLSAEADRDLMNRPFYWAFVERTGIQPEPLTLTLQFEHTDTQTKEEQLKGEFIQFGSSRLHQIFQSAIKRGKYVRLYENVPEPFQPAPLYPWLCLNYKIEFICDQKKEMLYSLGINLVSGEVLANFYTLLLHYSLTPKIPDKRYTITPIYSISSAANVCESLVLKRVEQEDMKWAMDAAQRLNDELELTRIYFDMEMEELQAASQQEHEKIKKLEEEKKRKEEELTWQFKPRIIIKPINVGIFYLSNHPLTINANIR
ncbi:YqhG family protein [Microaerobacter geothermalis]|uniref:YqhG family protein n=1 Tax=Microaerobacter geothermalis TaxID=674972 RepID=UPI001F20D097|nr:YqhG family protein [Microaerobacter geothermalis]MCF6094201.1 YqhG family protein [Microaerobacter geothermalis]